jgi:hypothetical protein
LPPRLSVLLRVGHFVFRIISHRLGAPRAAQVSFIRAVPLPLDFAALRSGQAFLQRDVAAAVVCVSLALAIDLLLGSRACPASPFLAKPAVTARI